MKQMTTATRVSMQFLLAPPTPPPSGSMLLKKNKKNRTLLCSEDFCQDTANTSMRRCDCCRERCTFGRGGSGCAQGLSFASVLDCCGCCLWSSDMTKFVSGDKKKLNHFYTHLELLDHVTGRSHLDRSYQMVQSETINLLWDHYNLLSTEGQNAVLTAAVTFCSCHAHKEIVTLGARLTCFSVNGAKPHT